MAGAWHQGGPVGELARLWRGELALGRAFWGYAVIGGLAVNLATSVLFLALMSADRPLAALAAGYGLSVPYNIVALIGVWRAADRFPGERAHADLARIATLAVMVVLTVT